MLTDFQMATRLQQLDSTITDEQLGWDEELLEYDYHQLLHYANLWDYDYDNQLGGWYKEDEIEGDHQSDYETN
jgi:hypothetical protein